MPSIPVMTEKRLPRQADKWSSFILNELRSWGQLPPGTVPDFQYIDSEKADQGYALASVVLDIGDNIVNVPVVIRDWKLMPMDIMELNGSLYPLTSRRLGQLAAFAAPFDDKVYPAAGIRDMGQNIQGAVMPPIYQRGMLKSFSDNDPNELLTAKLVAASNPDVGGRLQQLDQNAFNQYKAHGTYDVLHGLLKRRGKSDAEHIVDVEGGDIHAQNPTDDISVMWVPRPSQEDANKGFGTVAGASGRAFDPFMMHLPVKDLISMYSNMDGIDPLKKVQVFVSKDGPDGMPIVDTDWSGNPGHDVGVREIKPAELAPDRSLLLLGAEKGDNGHMFMIPPGSVIECLYLPDELSRERVAAMTRKCELFMGDKFYGVYAKTADAPASPSHNPPFTSDVASFGSLDGGAGGRDVIFASVASGGDVTAIGPMKIMSREVAPIDVLGEKHIVTTFHGRYGHVPIQVVRSELYKDYAGTTSDGGIKIFVPASFNCVGITGVVHSPKSPEDVDYMAKTAHIGTGDWVRGFSVDGGASITLNMPDMIKAAYQSVLDDNKTGIKLARMEPEQAEFVLIASGMKAADAASFVKSASREPITAYGIKYLPPKLAHKPDPIMLAKEAQLKRDLIAAISVDFFKEAAELNDKKTVDAVLGLGLADEGNVDVIIDAVPKYEEVLENLTWALKEARISGGPIQEQVIQKAMIAVENYLEQVEAYVAALQQLRSSQKGTSMAVPAA